MITDDDINAAFAVCDAASKGPAVWAADNADTVESAIARFLEHYRKARAVTDSPVCHQVDLAGAGRGAHCVAITGNGPTSAANAQFIAGALDPIAGWAAALREVRRLRTLTGGAL